MKLRIVEQLLTRVRCYILKCLESKLSTNDDQNGLINLQHQESNLQHQESNPQDQESNHLQNQESNHLQHQESNLQDQDSNPQDQESNLQHQESNPQELTKLEILAQVCNSAFIKDFGPPNELFNAKSVSTENSVFFNFVLTLTKV